MPSPRGVPVVLDKKRHLRYTWRALVKLEDETGLSVDECGAQLQKGSLKTMSAVIWAGLLHADPDLEPDDVLDMVDIERFQDIADAVGKAFTQAVGAADPQGDDEGPEKKGAEAD